MSRRRVGLISAVLVVLITLATWWLWSDENITATEQTSAAVAASGVSSDVRALKFERMPSLWDQPLSGAGALVLAGRVVDESGLPVANATVTATAIHGDDVLSDLACKCDNECGKKLLQCGCPEASSQLVESLGSSLRLRVRRRLLAVVRCANAPRQWLLFSLGNFRTNSGGWPRS